MTSIKEKELPSQFKEFNPAKMASLEMDWLLAEVFGKYKLVFNLHVQGLQEQFKLSEKAAKKVAGKVSPNVISRKLVRNTENYVKYYKQLSQETGLGFNVDPQWFGHANPDNLSKVFGEVYGVPQESLLPVMETRMEAFDSLMNALENNLLPKLDGKIVYPEEDLMHWGVVGKTFEAYYEGLKEVISV